MSGEFGLYQHPTGTLGTAGAPRHLCQPGEQPLAGTEIGAVKRAVGIDDPDQRELREVMAFGEYLRADQDIDFPRVDLAPHFLPCMLAARAVAVDAQHTRARKNTREGGFDIHGSVWGGLVAPKGLPADIRGKLVAACVKATASDGYKAGAARLNSPLVFRDAATFAAFAASEAIAYAAAVREFGLEEK